jgi:hypothetical protein
MKTFDELVKERDRNYIKRYIKISITKDITIHNNEISPIDFLILFVTKIKKRYIHNTSCNGICAARGLVTHHICSNKNYEGIYFSGTMLQELFEKDLAYDYVPTKLEWAPIPRIEMGYWWTIRYGQRNDKSMARCVKPRIMFMNWVIAVLTAYKNEYCNK